MSETRFWWEDETLTTSLSRPQFVDRIYQTLGDDDWQLRNAFVNWLKDHLEEDVIQLLFKALHDDINANRRNSALQVLSFADRRILPYIKKHLLSPVDDVRLFAVQLAGHFLTPDFIPDLIRCLKDPAENIRVAAIEALGRLGEASAVPELLEAAQVESDWVAFQAILALGQIGHPRSLETLIGKFLSGEESLRTRALLTSLPDYLEPVAVKHFVEAMIKGQIDPDIIRRSVRWFEPELIENDMITYIHVFHSWLFSLPDETLQDLKSLPWETWIRAGEDELHRAILYWGLILEHPHILQYIREHLHDPQWVEKARNLLIWTGIADTNTWLQFWHAIGRSDLLHLMVTARRHWEDDPEIQKSILDRWHDLELDTQVYVLEHILTPDTELTPTTFAWLERGWQSMTPELDRILYQWMKAKLSEERRVHHWQRQAETWMKAEEPWKRAVAVELYTLLAPQYWEQTIRQAVHDVHPWVRYIAVLSCDRVNLDSSLKRIIIQHALADEHPGVRELAVRLYPVSSPDFTDIMVSMVSDYEPWVQVTAIQRLAEQNDISWLPTFVNWYEEIRDVPVRAAILRWLGTFDHPDILNLYETTFEKVESDLQRAIAEGLGSFQQLKDEAESLVNRLLDKENLELSVRLALLATLARLNRKKWETWMEEHLHILEKMHQWTDLIDLLNRAGSRSLPEWTTDWLYKRETWPLWVQHFHEHPEWLSWIMPRAPWRLIRLLQIIGILEDDPEE